MKIRPIAGAIALTLLLPACTAVPQRTEHTDVQAAISGAVGVALPGSDEAYPDTAWFAEPMTVDRAVQTTLRNNPGVRAALKSLDVAQADYVQAGLISNPTLSLMLLRPEGGGRYELDYGLMQTLFDLFARSRRVAVADAVRKRQEADVIRQLLALAQDTRMAYFEVLYAEQAWQLQSEFLLLEQGSLILLQNQAQVGSVPVRQVLAQQSDVSQRANALENAKSDLIEARSALAQQLGLSSAKQMILPTTFPAFVVPGLDEPAMQALAARYRPDLQMASAEIAKAGAEQRLQTGGLRTMEPVAGLAGKRETDGMVLNGLAVQISIPFFDTGQGRRALGEAKLAQAEFAAEALKRQVPLEVERAIATLIVLQAANDSAGKRLQQQERLEMVAKRTYEQGNSDLAAYREAVKSTLNAHEDRLRAEIAVWTALIGLERATGVAMQNFP